MARYVHPQCDRVQLHGFVLGLIVATMIARGRRPSSRRRLRRRMPAISFGVGVEDDQIVLGRRRLRFVPPAASGQGRPGACEERAVEGRPVFAG